ncbi:N-acetyltransferase [Sphingomonas metalli]|uniref:N-acetyltransferase n=1 Tax=Sphingomonas metalli TaxID=1779358 RepID=A0A916WXU6_9SPHN|nr:GNAT family N-acetyltransferase [Sphingomonas metalli]GGB38989.1 N-acetyltransferase [Sphingomonas metalli]
MAPTLRTDRLILSAHRPEDLDSLVAIWSDPAVYRHIGGKPRTREEVWLQLLRHTGQWTLFGRGLWVVRDAATGDLLGEAGLMDTRRDFSFSLPDRPEAAWILGPAAHGRGLAREAMGAVHDWAAAQGMTRTFCIIGAENAASIRLAGRLGYEHEAEGQYHERPTVVMLRG